MPARVRCHNHLPRPPIDDALDSDTVTLVYDDNGNLVDDRIFGQHVHGYIYDAWNRLVETTYSP